MFTCPSASFWKLQCCMSQPAASAQPRKSSRFSRTRSCPRRRACVGGESGSLFVLLHRSPCSRLLRSFGSFVLLSWVVQRLTARMSKLPGHTELRSRLRRTKRDKEGTDASGCRHF